MSQTENPPAISPTARAAKRAEETLIGRVPPHSVDAEKAVLAGILVRQDIVSTMAEMLEDRDFYIPAHAIIFRTFLKLHEQNKPIELPSVAQALFDEKMLEQAGGSEFLTELTYSDLYAANAEYYAGVVREKSMQRRLIDTCAGIISRSYDAPDVQQLLDESEKSVFEVAQRMVTRETVSTKDLLLSVFSRLNTLRETREVVTGVSTGYSQLDALTAGLQKSDLVIVAARPSMGKTAFAICLALNAAIGKGACVGVFSLEMSKEQLVHRMLSVRGKVNMGKLRQPSRLTDSEFKDLLDAADVLGQCKIFIDDTPALSTLELRSRARRLKKDHQLDLIVIDYLQLMRASRRIDSREQEIADISRSLKGLAKELDIPVVALAQLNRKLEDRTDKRPQMSDLRESGAIEQDADMIMFIYREDVYNKKTDERPEVGNAEIIIGKQRNGPLGTAHLSYHAAYTSFEERVPDQFGYADNGGV